MELSQVQPASPPLLQLEYYLQSLSKASTLRITKAWEISNPSLTVQFDRKSKGLLILDSWIDCNDLRAPNEEADIVKKGFQNASVTPIVFPVGPIDLNGDSVGKQLRRMMVCKVAVGRAFCVASEQDPLVTANAMTLEGYDSFYVDPESNSQLESLDFCRSHDDEAIGYSVPTVPIKYIIKNGAQVLPRFIVEFEYDAKLERQSRQKATCENCEQEIASIYCSADAAMLCTNCDVEVHRSKLASRHHRISLDKGPQCAVACRLHPERTAEFFCPTCHLLVCLNCKMIGHHSTGDSVKHPLVSVSEAYQSVLESAHSPDPVIDEKKSTLRLQLGKIEKRGEAILHNAKTVREQIEAVYQKALTDLSAVVNKRLLVLKGDAQEYKRILQNIDRIKSYLEYLESGRDASLFLLSWHRYLEAKADLPFYQTPKDLQSVGGAIDSQPFYVSGNLTVVSETALKGESNVVAGSSHAGTLRGSTFSLIHPSQDAFNHYHHVSPRSTAGNPASIFKSSTLRLESNSLTSPKSNSMVENKSNLNDVRASVAPTKKESMQSMTASTTSLKKTTTDLFSEALQSLDLVPSI